MGRGIRCPFLRIVLCIHDQELVIGGRTFYMMAHIVSSYGFVELTYWNGGYELGKYYS